jgi:hypothetical protein
MDLFRLMTRSNCGGVCSVHRWRGMELIDLHPHAA